MDGRVSKFENSLAFGNFTRKKNFDNSLLPFLANIKLSTRL